MSLNSKSKKEILQMLQFSEFEADEMLDILFKTAQILDLDIADPFDRSISVSEFLDQFKNQMRRREHINNF